MTAIGQHLAPCGHPGTPIIGTYIMCPTCDRPRAAAAKGLTSPALDAKRKIDMLEIGRLLRREMDAKIAFSVGLYQQIHGRFAGAMVTPFASRGTATFTLKPDQVNWMSGTPRSDAVVRYEVPARDKVTVALSAVQEAITRDLASNGSAGRHLQLLRRPKNVTPALDAANRLAAVNTLELLLRGQRHIWLPLDVHVDLFNWMGGPQAMVAPFAGATPPLHSVVSEVNERRMRNGEKTATVSGTAHLVDRLFVCDYDKLELDMDVFGLSDVLVSDTGEIAIHCSWGYRGYRLVNGGRVQVYT